MSTAKIITVTIIEHRGTGLLLGISDDLKGLYVHGRSVSELENRLPGAIKEVIEASGQTNVQVLPVEENDPLIPSSFLTTRSVRKYALAA